MKRYYLFLVLTATLFITACSSDDEVKEKPLLALSMFEGKWFSEDNDTYLNMTYSAFSGSTYANNLISDEVVFLTGKWMLFPANSLARFEVHYSTRDYSETRDYKVISLDDNSMILYDLELNAQYTYHKVVSQRDLLMGDSFAISEFIPQGSSFTSSCEYIAKVDGQGRAVATAPGTAYVGAVSNGKKSYVRVDVEQRIGSYVIDFLSSIDNIIEKYGTPDYSGPSDSPNMVISYYNNINDASLSYIHYRYDEQTREITEIVAHYNNDDIYFADLSYIKENYYPFLDENSFAIDPWFANNTFFMMLLEQEDLKILVYQNKVYHDTHGYF